MMISSATHEFDRKLTTGCPILDDFLKNGLPTGQVTEIYGESSTGKSTFALQMLLNVQLPFDHGGLEGGALYISTIGRFCSKRLAQIFQSWRSRLEDAAGSNSTLANGSDPKENELDEFQEKYLNQIHILHLRDLETQTHFLKYQIKNHMERNNIKLLVIDTIAGNFRVPEDGQVDQFRAKMIFETGEILHSIASSLNAVVLCINEVSAKFERSVKIGHDSHGVTLPLSEPNDGCNFVPALGVALSVIVNNRIRFQRNLYTDSRSMEVVFSPYLPTQYACEYKITNQGIRGVQKE